MGILQFGKSEKKLPEIRIQRLKGQKTIEPIMSDRELNLQKIEPKNVPNIEQDINVDPHIRILVELIFLKFSTERFLNFVRHDTCYINKRPAKPAGRSLQTR